MLNHFAGDLPHYPVHKNHVSHYHLILTADISIEVSCNLFNVSFNVCGDISSGDNL